MIITRFAPSPTGYIHLGNVRIAFLCWLFAKKNKGKFYIRIDDTDYVRNSQKYVNNILDILNWFNIKSDENIIFQSKNLDIYRYFLNILLDEKKAYKCFCTKERLDDLKKYQINNKKKIAYDEYCKNLNRITTDNFVIRFNNCTEGFTTIYDLVKGIIKINNNEFDDFIIAKQDFFPTYNFASVVDDISYNITHIIRGDDHMSNTVKQIHLMTALSFKLPHFAHLPMILDENKKVLSKRDTKSYVNYYIEEGFLPAALLNYIIRLNWSFNDKEIFSLDDMLKFFDFSDVNKSPAAINMKKLTWLNKFYLRSYNYNDLIYYFLYIEKKFNLNYLVGPRIKDLIVICKNRVDTLKQIFFDYYFLYEIKCFINDKDFFIISSVESKDCIIKFYYDLKKSNFVWSQENIKDFIKRFSNCNNFSMAFLGSVFRIVLTGSNRPNSLYEIFFLCGKILILKKFRNIIREITGAIAQHG